MAEKYKLKKTIITNNREKEVTVPHAKRFSLEEAQKWLANRKKKIGAGTFKSYEVKESGKLSLSANPPYLVAWEFQETGKKKAKKKAKAKAPKKKAKAEMSVVKGGKSRKKHTAKKSALKKKETARRSKKKVVADVKQESRFRQFEVGKSYHIDKYINPYSERYITVIKRAKKKITFTVGGYPDKYEAFIETSKKKDGSVSSEYIIFLKTEYYFADAPFSPAQK